MGNPDFYPVQAYTVHSLHQKEGERMARKGSVACFLLAGGMGSRLGIYGAKGCFSVTLLQKKSFFELIFEKIVAYQKKFTCEVEIGIMVSSSTENQIKPFFQKHKYFGVKSSQVTFFVQPDLAYLDEQLNPVTHKGKILQAGNGNGGAIEVLQKSEWIDKLLQKRVQYLHVVPIDNVLLDPLNLAMTGILSREEADVAIAATKREEKEKNFGVLVQQENQIAVIDYMELPKIYQGQPLEKVFPYINTAHYALKIAWLKAILPTVTLPIHWVKKKVPYKKEFLWKRETFFFDLFRYTSKITTVYLPKAQYFSPLKERKDLPKVQKALQKRDRILLQKLFPGKIGKGPYELSADFLYRLEELKAFSLRKIPAKGYLSFKILEDLEKDLPQ